MKLIELNENTSSTLKALHDKDKDAKNLDRVVAKAFGPSEDYPAPWRAYKADPMGIYEIYAANNKRVTNWINKTNAEKIVSEVN